MLDSGSWRAHLALQDLDLDDLKAAESVAKRFLVRDLDAPELDARQLLREVLQGKANVRGRPSSRSSR